MIFTPSQIKIIQKLQRGTRLSIPTDGRKARVFYSLADRGIVSLEDDRVVFHEDVYKELNKGKWDHISLPALTILNFSGGKQSSALLWMVLRGDIEVDKDSFLVLNANPGMENSGTYDYVAMMFEKCKEQGIHAVTVDGPDLYEDTINLKNTDQNRFDNPPYWTKSVTGKMGRLRQKCTQVYKIFPMDRYIRKVMRDRFGIGIRATRGIPEDFVEKWIGFSYSEVQRIKPSKQKYIKFRYPLIEMKMDNESVLQYFKNNDLPIPPRSVCNACFANGLNTFKDMYYNRPSDWEQAVNVDEAVRDWQQIMIHDEVYVSNTLIPLKVLAENDFDIESIKGEQEDTDDYSCDSGYCFV